MSITDNKITKWNNPIVNEADRPQRSASDMKAIFDSNSNQLREALNALIDALSEGGASDIGAAVKGMEGENVENLLAELKRLVDSAKEAHDNLDDLFARFVEDLAASEGAAMVGASVEGIEGGNVAAILTALKVLSDRIVTDSDGELFLADDGTYRLPSVGAAANGLPDGGNQNEILFKTSDKFYDAAWVTLEEAGVMQTAKYDADGDGIVDDAKKLDGHTPSYFATADALREESSNRTMAINAITASDVSAIPASEKGVANGVAALEANAKVVATHATSLVVSQTNATINVTENMNGRFFYVNNANAVTVVLPDPASVPNGFEAEFVQWGTGTVTFQLNSSLSGKYLFSLDSAKQIAGRYGTAVIKQISSSSWLLAGALI